MRLTLTLIAVVTLAEVGRAQDGIPAKTLHELKRGTVFLRVKSGFIAGTGSGFLIQRDGTTGYIITNSHVVHLPKPGTGVEAPASSIEAVFFSGAGEEVSCKAEILANLPDEDLALLVVKEVKGLPAPLQLSSAAEFAETMPVYCLGFPFGELLAVDNQNPAVTVSRGSVSSLRRDKEGKLVGVQIDGALNPGNSGGPVVDKEGRIIGVAVKAVRGARIGLAIPAAEVAGILGGRPTQARAHIAKTAADGIDVAFEVKLADPFQRVRTVTVHYVREDAAKEKPAIGQVKPLTGTSKADLSVKDQKAAGSIRLPENKQVSYWLQVGYTGGDGKQGLLGVMALRLDATGRLHLVQHAVPREADKIIKRGIVFVHFALADADLRKNLVEHIKDRVGNPITRHGTLTSGTQVTLEIFPVNDPPGFVERLQEIGKITRIQGQEIFFTLTDVAAVAKPPQPPANTAQKTPSFPAGAPLWTMDLAKMNFPEKPVQGIVAAKSFTVDSARLAPNSNLTLTMGTGIFPERMLNFHLHTSAAEIGGKVFHVDPNDPAKSKGPYLYVQKKDASDKIPRGVGSWTSGYALKLEFGQVQDGVVTGRLYLCMPAEAQTVVAGTFVVRVDGKASPALATAEPKKSKTDPGGVAKTDAAKEGKPADVPPWTLELAKMKFPDRPAGGKLLGAAFTLEEAGLNRLTLTLRRGKASAPEAAITIFHGLKADEGIGGKTYQVEPGQPGLSIHLRQTAPGNGLPRATVATGYALKLEFGQVQDGMVTGRIYFCLPEDKQTVVAGTFVLKLSGKAAQAPPVNKFDALTAKPADAKEVHQPEIVDLLTWKRLAAGIANKAVLRSDVPAGIKGVDGPEDIAAEARILIGMNITKTLFIESVQPIYLTPAGEKLGGWIGSPKGTVHTLKAEPGYAVGAINLRTGELLDSLTLVFMKIKKDGLDTDDAYRSPLVGGPRGNPFTVGGDGAFLVGIQSKTLPGRYFVSAGAPTSLGVVSLKK